MRSRGDYVDAYSMARLRHRRGDMMSLGRRASPDKRMTRIASGLPAAIMSVTPPYLRRYNLRISEVPMRTFSLCWLYLCIGARGDRSDRDG